MAFPAQNMHREICILVSGYECENDFFNMANNQKMHTYICILCLDMTVRMIFLILPRFIRICISKYIYVVFG